jgi:hypothetical protein
MAGPGRPKTGGRKKGTPNKIQRPAAEVRKAIAARVRAQVDKLEKQANNGAGFNERIAARVRRISPLEYMLDILEDDRQPPTFRFEAAKAAAPYIHSRAAEQPSEHAQVNHVTEIRRVIVKHEGGRIPDAPWREPVSAVVPSGLPEAPPASVAELAAERIKELRDGTNAPTPLTPWEGEDER